MKRVVGIFAHPDDEALGPSGTLAILAKDHEVYLICVTNGEAEGKTPKDKKTIAKTRQSELLTSAKILGIKKVFFLNYVDGELNNKIYHKLYQDIFEKITLLRPETIITYEMRGVSGHIDHVTTSLVSSYVFQKNVFIKKIMYYVITKKESDLMQNYFIFFPPGFRRDQVDEIVTIESVWDIKVKAMFSHKSQQHDVEMVLQNTAGFPREEYFLVNKR